LIGGEKEGISILEGEIYDVCQKGELCLVGRQWTEKTTNKEAFQTSSLSFGEPSGFGTVVFKKKKKKISWNRRKERGGGLVVLEVAGGLRWGSLSYSRIT
jgi:hypothetical protein